MGDATGHYFEAEPGAASKRRTVRLDLPDRSLSLLTDRGVFSAQGVAAATKYLLLEAPAPPPEGTFVDLGCGYGPIACTLAARAPSATVWAVDVNRRALDLCRDNAAALGLTNVEVHDAGAVPPMGEIDLVWSNPPIRIGKAPLHDLLTGWLRRLSPAGSAVLVVHQHLGADSLHRWLEAEGWAVGRIGSRSGNRLLEVRRS